MRKKKDVQIGLRLDSHIVMYLTKMPGDNDSEKLRHLINEGIEYRNRREAILSKAFCLPNEVAA